MPAIVWKGYISFGLVSFPVRLFAAGRAEPVHFHMLHAKDLSRVKEVWYCAQEDKPIERSEIVKGYETSKGKYVVVEDDELKAIAPATASSMEVVQFVKESEVDPIFFEHSYYVGPGENVTKPYALFVKALHETGYCAIAKLSMHNREHVVLIRSANDALVLHTLFYSAELHAANKQSISAKNVNRKELDLAASLIHQLAAPFKPAEFHDTYREKVEKLIADKSRGRKIEIAPKARRAPVIDLMEALKKSLRASATAAKSVSSKPAKARARTTRTSRRSRAA